MTYALITALVLSIPGETPVGDIQAPGYTGGTLEADIHLIDDIALEFGNTDAAPDARLLWDTSGTDQLQIWLTDCDGGGTDCVPAYWATGTDDMIVSGAIKMATGEEICLVADCDAKIYEAGDDIYLYANGALKMRLMGTQNRMNQEVDMNANDITLGGGKIYDDAQALDIGTAAATGHGLATGDAIFGGDVEIDGTLYMDGAIVVPAYSVDYVIDSGSAAIGAGVPVWLVNGSVGGLEFDQDADQVFLNFEVPDCWDGASDLTLKVYWVPEVGDAIQNGETVKWDFVWRSLDWGTEDTDTGAANTDTVTYTEAASPGDDNDTHESSMTLAYSGVISAGDVLTGQFDRDVTTDTYSGGGIVQHWEVSVTQTALDCDHN